MESYMERYERINAHAQERIEQGFCPDDFSQGIRTQSEWEILQQKFGSEE